MPYTFNSTGSITMLQIRNGLGVSGTPISLDYLRTLEVLMDANPFNPPNVPTTGAISLGDYRGKEVFYNPY
jgi:hypothetical protein